MKACELLAKLEKMGIHVITGVPDSTLKQFCDGLEGYQGDLKHYVTVNEGAAVGLAMGSYLASGQPACIYMQNSGIGNAVNPLTSLANADVYGIPMLFIVGFRGEPGTKDEPQHVYQGKITCELFDILSIPYAMINKRTSLEELDDILRNAEEAFSQNKQFAIIVKKGTFEQDSNFRWENGNTMNREKALAELLKAIPREACVVSTTGKISRELYEQSNQIYGNHDNIFMTVGGMGHASMIAFGLAANRPDQSVVCIDGDGAALMHMGSMAFISSQAPKNLIHVVINNQAHESVGAMPTGCQQLCFTDIATAAGYKHVMRICSYEQIEQIGKEIGQKSGPLFFEIPVTLDSREDLSRPAETPQENKEAFMKNFR